MKQLTYKHTIRACFAGYGIQAIINNFIPLLFVFFGNKYNIGLSEIAFLITFNFAVQLLVDVAGAFIVDKVGYRVSMVAAHFFAAAGFVSLIILPDVMSSAYAGIVISVVLYAIGGGLLEVLVSPVAEACPTENKQSVMAVLHSFYCWGHVSVVIISTIFFAVAGIENWRWLVCLWIAICVYNGIMFALVPIYDLVEEQEESISLFGLLKNKLFWMLMVMMFAAGSSEQAVSQWSSAFAEAGLKVPKAIGDLAGPMFFAIMMGLSRAIYSKLTVKFKLEHMMYAMTFLCLISYLIIALSPVPALSLVGCGICGFSVGIMWPGTFSIAAALLRRGGTALFALLALAGDLGCGGGPTYVGMISDKMGGALDKGILYAVIFPILMIIGLFILDRFNKNVENDI